MKFPWEALSVLLLVAGTLAQELNLEDFFDDVVPTPEKPKITKKPDAGGDIDLNLEDALGPDPKPKPEKPAAPAPKPGGGDFELDLSDALAPADPKPKPEKPAAPAPKPGGSDFELDLSDALGPDLEPKKPAKDKPNVGGGGGRMIDDSDLTNVAEGDYKPEGGRSGSTGHNTDGGADQPQEASAGPLAGIISAVGVALVGAASSYFAYQKKKLCFKIQGGEDPERGKEQQGQSDPQVYSNLLKTS